jgi:hypothetical protein
MKLLRLLVMEAVMEHVVEPPVVGVKLPRLSTTAFRLPATQANRFLVIIVKS